MDNSSELEANNIIVRLLARREYSLYELRQRLQQKGFTEAIADTALEKAVEAGWQSDERYALALIRSRIGRLHGPAKIRAELRQKGVHASMAEQCLQELTPDWEAMALEYISRNSRYHQAPLKARQALHRRGYDSAQINHALREWATSSAGAD